VQRPMTENAAVGRESEARNNNPPPTNEGHGFNLPRAINAELRTCFIVLSDRAGRTICRIQYLLEVRIELLLGKRNYRCPVAYSLARDEEETKMRRRVFTGDVLTNWSQTSGNVTLASSHLKIWQFSYFETRKNLRGAQSLALPYGRCRAIWPVPG
jgi:hypothetical protein